MRALLAVLGLIVAVPLAVGPARAGPALLFDADSGEVLYAEDPDNQWHPASLTKVMTAYLVFEALKAGKIALDTKVVCSAAAALQAPSKLGLPVGKDITVDVALQALIVHSANDVAVMLAETVAGTEPLFVAQMNETAKRLGMDRTSFVNVNGLPASGQITTARDLAKLARAVLKDFPEYTRYWSLPEMRLGKRRLGTHNALLGSFEGADGLKTGFICDSGYNVIASATRDGHKLIAVILGSPSGAERHVLAASMLERGFATEGWKRLFSPDSIDTLPAAVDAKTVLTMTSEYPTWDCGLRRIAPPKARRARAAKAAVASKDSDAAAAAPADKTTKTPPAAQKTTRSKGRAKASGKTSAASVN